MLHCFLLAPFADIARQRQYEAVCAALDAEAGAPTTLLLGNLSAVGIDLDAVVVRPRSVVALVLEPQSGYLSIPTLEYGSWKLSGQPLPGRGTADNPFDQYQQQRSALTLWLGEELGRPTSELPPLTGLVLFEAPLSFGPEVERQLRHYPAVGDFQLLSDPQQLPRRLWQLAQPELVLAEHDLLAWAGRLEGALRPEEPTSIEVESPAAPAGYWTRKLRQLWGWLGAEDVPADPPYGAPTLPAPPTPPVQHPEQQRLAELRRELQQQLSQQQQAAAMREAAQAQELATLRQQVTQAGQAPATQQQEQALQEQALEEALRDVRAEAASRMQELDARIQQLGQLLNDLRRSNAVPAAPAPRPVGRGSRPTPTRPTKAQRLIRLERAALLVLVLLLGLVAGIWGVRYLSRPKTRPHATQSAHRPASHSEAAPPVAVPADTAAPADSLPTPAEPAVLDEVDLQSVDPDQVMRLPSDSAVRAMQNE